MTIFDNFMSVVAHKRYEIMALALATIIMMDSLPETADA